MQTREGAEFAKSCKMAARFDREILLLSVRSNETGKQERVDFFKTLSDFLWVKSSRG